MTQGFLILIGYRGEYVPSARATGEISRARERQASMVARPAYQTLRMPRPHPTADDQRAYFDRVLSGGTE